MKNRTIASMNAYAVCCEPLLSPKNDRAAYTCGNMDSTCPLFTRSNLGQAVGERCHGGCPEFQALRQLPQPRTGGLGAAARAVVLRALGRHPSDAQCSALGARGWGIYRGLSVPARSFAGEKVACVSYQVVVLVSQFFAVCRPISFPVLCRPSVSV